MAPALLLGLAALGLLAVAAGSTATARPQGPPVSPGPFTPKPPRRGPVVYLPAMGEVAIVFLATPDGFAKLQALKATAPSETETTEIIPITGSPAGADSLLTSRGFRLMARNPLPYIGTAEGPPGLYIAIARVTTKNAGAALPLDSTPELHALSTWRKGSSPPLMVTG